MATAVVDRPPRHSALVRSSHWIVTVCVFFLLLTGIEIIVSHPRFYWGEEGNPNTESLFDIPIPASRPWVKTGYNYVLPDQNGWSRSLHFQSAWVLVIVGLVYTISGIMGHFQRNRLIYNDLQRITYLVVIFGLFPLAIWTGLAMSPAVTSAMPFLVTSVGGTQSARTIHFFVSLALVVFSIGHVVMVYRAGFRKLVRAMITGKSS